MGTNTDLVTVGIAAPTFGLITVTVLVSIEVLILEIASASATAEAVRRLPLLVLPISIFAIFAIESSDIDPVSDETTTFWGLFPDAVKANISKFPSRDMMM